MYKKRKQKQILFKKSRKTAFPDDAKAREKLEKLPKIWYVGFWAHYGVRSEILGGFDRDGHPLVWYFDDHNGTYSEWVLTRLEYTTTGAVITWGDARRREKLEKIADLLEADLIKRQQEMREKLQEEMRKKLSENRENRENREKVQPET